MHGNTVPSVAFGPTSVHTRAEAFEIFLQRAWAHSATERPAAAHISAVAWSDFGGILDEREENPTKYPRHV